MKSIGEIDTVSNPGPHTVMCPVAHSMGTIGGNDTFQNDIRFQDRHLQAFHC
jgi:hypothetical protein